VQLVSLSHTIHVLPVNGSQPIAVVALFGDLDQDDAVVRVQVQAAVPIRGGLLTFGRPVVVLLSHATVAGTQQVELPAKQAEQTDQ
jgi:hypothetical protein